MHSQNLRVLASGIAVTFFVIFLAGILAFSLSFTPDTMVALQAKTEIIRLRVTDPAAASFPLQGTFDEDTGECLPPVLVSPARGTELIYARPIGKPFTLSIIGEASWATAEKTIGATDARGIKRFLLDINKDCAVSRRVRLPANGVLTVGAETTYAADPNFDNLLLTEGHLSVMGRAVARHGWPPPFNTRALYQAERIELLPGSRVSEAKNTNSNRATVDAPWRGFVDIRLDSLDSPLDLSASTNAKSVQLYLPAAPEINSRGAPKLRLDSADTLSLSLFARLTGDPHLRFIYACLSIIVFVVTLGGIIFKSCGIIFKSFRTLFSLREKI